MPSSPRGRSYPRDGTQLYYFYNARGEERQTLAVVAAAYNQAHPDVTVNVTTDFDIPEADPLAEMARRFDCFTWTPSDWKSLERDNLLLSLNALLDSEGSQNIQDFDQVFMDVFRHEGELYGLPAFSVVRVMAYNAELLAERGLRPPANDWTFDEFIDMIKAATSTAEADRSYGFLFDSYDFLLFEGRGAEWADFKSDPPIPMLDSLEFASALDWLDYLIETGVLLVEQDFTTTRQAIMAGQVAFWTTYPEWEGDWFSVSGQRPNYKTGLAPMPAVEGSPRMFSWWTQGHYISGKAKEPRLCWDWIKFLSEQPAVFKGIPARMSVAESSEWEAVVGEENAAVYRLAVLNAIRETIKAHKEVKYSPVSSSLYLWQNQAVTAMVKGEDYRRLLPKLQKKAEDYLACMRTVEFARLNDEELLGEIYRCEGEVESQGD